MGFVGFLQFSLNCVELFAWPILALVYPLFASIQAIETNSNYHMRKLVTYWILFSLISLFELTFVRFIEWFSIWPYMKIIAICWLVIPRFGHAYNAYKSLVQIRSYANMQAFVNWLIKQDKVTFLKTEETFLSVAEKFIKENGTEALEELISNKSKDTKTNLDAKKKMGVAITEKKEELISNKLKDTKTNLDAKEKMGVTITEKKEDLICNKLKDTKTNLDAKEKMGVTITEEKAELISNKSKGTKTNLDAKEKMGVTITEKKEIVTTIESKAVANTDKKESPSIEVKQSNAKLAETERKIAEAVEIKEMNNMPTAEAAGAGGEKYYHPSSSLDKGQTHWSCAVCQVTTPSQTILNFHLQGKKHLAKCKKLEAKKKQTPKNNYSSSSTTSKSGQANQNANKCSFGNRENQSKSKQQEKKYWCSLCNVKCPEETHLASHFKGKKHLSKVQELFTSFSGAQP